LRIVKEAFSIEKAPEFFRKIDQSKKKQLVVLLLEASEDMTLKTLQLLISWDLEEIVTKLVLTPLLSNHIHFWRSAIERYSLVRHLLASSEKETVHQRLIRREIQLNNPISLGYLEDKILEELSSEQIVRSFNICLERLDASIPSLKKYWLDAIGNLHPHLPQEQQVDAEARLVRGAQSCGIDLVATFFSIFERIFPGSLPSTRPALEDFTDCWGKSFGRNALLGLESGGFSWKDNEHFYISIEGLPCDISVKISRQISQSLRSKPLPETSSISFLNCFS